MNSYVCESCQVQGRGDRCWSCGSTDLKIRNRKHYEMILGRDDSLSIPVPSVTVWEMEGQPKWTSIP